MARILLTVMLILFASTILTSCMSSYGVDATGVPVSEAYSGGKGDNRFRYIASRSPLYQEKRVPILFPPKVFGCYIPSHVDKERDLLIGEHWIFFKVSGSSWFIEEEQEEVKFETKELEDPDKLVDVKLFVIRNIKDGIIPVKE